LSSHQSIHDRNILLYLATIESHVQQLLPNRKIYRKGRGNQGYTDDTTISWRIDHQTIDTPFNSLLISTAGNNQDALDNLRAVGAMTPQIPA
jgi:hypothetical protein